MEQASSSGSGVVAYFDRVVVETMRDFQDPSQEWRRLCSELLGTFFLVLVAAGGGMMGQFCGTGRALQAVPPADRDKVVNAAHYAFATGFNTIALVSVAVAAVGSVAGYALVRSRGFVTAGEGGGAGLGTPNSPAARRNAVDPTRRH